MDRKDRGGKAGSCENSACALPPLIAAKAAPTSGREHWLSLIELAAARAHSDIGSGLPHRRWRVGPGSCRPHLLPPSTALFSHLHGQFDDALKLRKAGEGLNLLGKLD